jgi:hypothetical protein
MKAYAIPHVTHSEEYLEEYRKFRNLYYNIERAAARIRNDAKKTD